ncbi:DUF493 family protein [Cytophagaceae bacterium ABcell3]|nr:DUF493 family protein [Cytophagaceae bacterium ABcell3]
MGHQNYNGLREKLADMDWPSFYMFKFIVPRTSEEEIFKIFNQEDIKTRLSRNGKYISITAYQYMNSEDDVIDVYEQASHVEGVISL